MIAYCFRDGLIQVTDETSAPEGALELFRGPHRSVLRVTADTTDNKQIKGLDTSTGLSEDFRILADYLEELRIKDHPLITVSDLTMEQVEKEVASYGA